MIAAGVEWTSVLLALIGGVPSILATIFAYLARKEVKTNHGTTLSQLVQESHEKAVDTNEVVHAIAENGQEAAA